MRKRDARRILLSDDIDETFEQIKREQVARQAHPYVADLIRILAPHKLGLSRQQTLAFVWQIRSSAPLNRPRQFDNAVQSAFNRHCGQSDTFKLSASEDLFTWPKGKGTGVWAVKPDAASAWLMARGLPAL